MQRRDEYRPLGMIQDLEETRREQESRKELLPGELVHTPPISRHKSALREACRKFWNVLKRFFF